MTILKKGLLVGAVVSLALFVVPVMAVEETYRSELTGEYISASLKDQRPVAVIVDNESIALPHFGTADGDVVYELMNSTLNGRITRLMVLVKDWGKITQMGSIRSVRPSNIPLAGEWNAVLVHDGGPFYVNAYFAKPYAVQHFSGDFSRVENGKPYEFTEYVLAGDLQARFARTGYPTTYNEFRNPDESHFQFAADGQTVSLPEIYGSASFAANQVSLPFYHNGSTLRYNAETETYDYYEYGSIHQDAQDGRTLTFDNVILQDVGYVQLDENGYMEYQLLGEGLPAYYLTKGSAIPITWTKTEETDITRFYDGGGNEITINTGKTYIGFIPADTWYEVNFAS